MSPQTDKLIEDAIRLSEADRIRLAERLLATLDGEPDAGAADAWAEEIERRTREIEQGLVKPLPWSAVKDAAARKARDHAEIVFHPEASEEYGEAYAWYAVRSAQVADRFEREVSGALERIAEAPSRWPAYDDVHRSSCFAASPIC